MRGRGALGRRGGGLDVTGGHDAREGSEKPSKGAFGQPALKSRAAIAAEEPANAKERPERPVRRDRTAVRGLKHTW